MVIRCLEKAWSEQILLVVKLVRSIESFYSDQWFQVEFSVAPDYNQH